MRRVLYEFNAKYPLTIIGGGGVRESKAWQRMIERWLLFSRYRSEYLKMIHALVLFGFAIILN